MIRTHKSLVSAVKAAKGEPVLAVGDLFITGIKSWTVISLLHDREEKGLITAQRLNELGNAQRAIASRDQDFQRKPIWWKE